MMTHGNVLATVSAVMTIVPNLGINDVYLAFLPMAHILELVAEVWVSTSSNELNKYFSSKGTLFVSYFPVILSYMF